MKLPRSSLTHTLCATAAILLLTPTAATASQRVLIIGGGCGDNSGNVPACGPMPRVTEAQLRGNP